MALTLRRRERLRPMRDVGPFPRGGAAPVAVSADDYLVEGEHEPHQPTAVDRVLSTLQIVLIILMAVLSLAVFWTLGVILSIL